MTSTHPAQAQAVRIESYLSIKTRAPRGFTFYDGPSMLTGERIIGIALVHSSNRKTGDMVQTYILRADMRPTDAVRIGADVAICGMCPQRPALGGACYVVVCQGPTVVFKTWQRGAYPARTWRKNRQKQWCAGPGDKEAAGKIDSYQTGSKRHSEIRS